LRDIPFLRDTFLDHWETMNRREPALRKP
jgi:hypothetical protein